MNLRILSELNKIAIELENRGLEKESIVVDRIFRKIAAIDPSDMLPYEPENFYDSPQDLKRNNEQWRLDQGGFPDEDYDLMELNNGVVRDMDRANYDAYANGDTNELASPPNMPRVQQPNDRPKIINIDKELIYKDLSIAGEQLRHIDLANALKYAGVYDKIMIEYSSLLNFLKEWLTFDRDNMRYHKQISTRFQELSDAIFQFSNNREYSGKFTKATDSSRKVARWLGAIARQIAGIPEQGDA